MLPEKSPQRGARERASGHRGSCRQAAKRTGREVHRHGAGLTVLPRLASLLSDPQSWHWQSPTGQGKEALLLPSGDLGSTPSSTSKSSLLCTPFLGLSSFTCHRTALSLEGCGRPQVRKHLRGAATTVDTQEAPRPAKAPAPGNQQAELHRAAPSTKHQLAHGFPRHSSERPLQPPPPPPSYVLYLFRMFLSGNLLFDLNGLLS